MKLDIKPRNSRLLKCWRCIVSLYLLLFCVLGIAVGLFAAYLLVFRNEIHGLSPKIILYFTLVPTSSVIVSAVAGWHALRRINGDLVKLVAVLLGVTTILEISGGIWCLSAQQTTHDVVTEQISKEFSKIAIDKSSENYWNNIQKKFHCCGFVGLTDYRSAQAIPFSCCGSSDADSFLGPCNHIWQKGCSDVISNALSKDLNMLSLVAFGIAILQVPGAFLTWCFANRISRETN